MRIVPVAPRAMVVETMEKRVDGVQGERGTGPNRALCLSS